MEERVKEIRDMLLGMVAAQLNDVDKVNTCELGEVIDMIKDLEEILYHNHMISRT